MSPRNFTRRFVEEFGTTPLRFVTRLRIESATRLIAENRLSRDEIAQACGFGSVDSLERALREPPANTSAPVMEGAIQGKSPASRRQHPVR